ncbi:MAG: lipoyl(octanoyl) transferase LipB [Candidatus Nanopelagicaceae bacterium]|jgi:lipoyl(octanoyl) transferase
MAIKVADISVIELGLMDYEECWQLQRNIHNEVASGLRENTLILVEHPPVFTAGRRTQEIERPQNGTPVIDVDRGGRITWHGPGQIVGYPIVRLEKRNEVVGFVRTLENAMIETLKEFGVTGISISEKTGVWIKDVNERKIAAIGVRVAQGVTMHGFALNIDPDLSYFDQIIACGMPEAKTTSLAMELNREVMISEVSPALKSHMLAALAQVSSQVN